MRELTLQESAFVAGGHAGPHPEQEQDNNSGKVKRTKGQKLSAKLAKAAAKLAKAQAKLAAFCEADTTDDPAC